MSEQRRFLVIGAVIAVLVLAAGYLLVVKPQKSKVTDLQTQAQQQEQANQLLVTQITALQSEQKQLPQQQLALQKFTTQVPDSAAEPTLIRQLTSVAHVTDVELVSITPGAEAVLTATAPTSSGTLGTAGASGALTELPIQLAIIGSYANVEAFFSALEKLPRALLVTQFTICPVVSAGVGTACTGPTEPPNKVAPPGAVSATISADVFFTPTDDTTTTTTTSQTLGTTPGTTATTPAGGAPDVTGPSTTGAVASGQ